MLLHAQRLNNVVVLEGKLGIYVYIYIIILIGGGSNSVIFYCRKFCNREWAFVNALGRAKIHLPGR